MSFLVWRMAMATEICVPTLGESVSEATIGRWLKKPGDAVKADEPLVELETDKVTLEVNAPAAGTLGDISAKDGETVTPGALLGSIVEGAGASASASAKAAEARKPSRASLPEASRAAARTGASRKATCSPPSRTARPQAPPRLRQRLPRRAHPPRRTTLRAKSACA